MSNYLRLQIALNPRRTSQALALGLQGSSMQPQSGAALGQLAGGALGSLTGALLRQAIEEAKRKKDEERRRQVECLEAGGTWIPASGKGKGKVPGYCKRERQTLYDV